MVCSFGGGMAPGTPDGMFEDDSGSLTCVQVVRVPLLPGMSLKAYVDRVYDTVLTKVIKSQIWMKSTRIVPQNFIIFCWFMPLLRPQYLATALLHSRKLIQRVAGGGWPFSLKVAVPDAAGDVFPERFASQYHGHMKLMSNFKLSDIVSFCVDAESDDEPEEWDIFSFEIEFEQREQRESETMQGSEDEAREQDTVQEDEYEEDDDQENPVFEAALLQFLAQYMVSVIFIVTSHTLKKPAVARQRESPLTPYDCKIQALGSPIRDDKSEVIYCC